VFLVEGSIADAELAGRKILEADNEIEIEYFEIKSNDLVSQPKLDNARVFVAVTIEDVRLIDNLEIAK
jgi:pantothenate synthetase